MLIAPFAHLPGLPAPRHIAGFFGAGHPPPHPPFPWAANPHRGPNSSESPGENKPLLLTFRGVFLSLILKHFPSTKRKRERGAGSKRKRKPPTSDLKPPFWLWPPCPGLGLPSLLRDLSPPPLSPLLLVAQPCGLTPDPHPNLPGQLLSQQKTPVQQDRGAASLAHVAACPERGGLALPR